MSDKLSNIKEQISALVAKEIREMDLNNVLDEETIQKIKEKTKERVNSDSSQEEDDEREIMENDDEEEKSEEEEGEGSEEKLKGGLADNMPDEDFDYDKLLKGIEMEMKHHTNNFQKAKEIVKDNLVEDPHYYDEDESENEGEENLEGNEDEGGEENLDQTTEDEEDYPQLPNFIHKIEPAEVLVFNQNELSHGGENLANLPLRTVEDPDCKKSLHDFWVEEAKKKADVYLAKFEKIGQLEFDHRNGTAQFKENRIEDVDTSKSGEHYQGNPYTEEPQPQLDDGSEETEERGIESYIKNSVDLENKVKEYIENILKDYFSGSQEDENYIAEEKNQKIEEKQSYPQEKSHIQENNIKMQDIAKNENQYKKIDTPQKLKESIKNGGGEAELISKGDSVQEWMLEGKRYFFPTQIISYNKCYIQKENL